MPNEGGLEPQCRNSVEQFMEVVDPISDYKLNYALMDNCGDYVEDHCKMEQGYYQVVIIQYLLSSYYYPVIIIK